MDIRLTVPEAHVSHGVLDSMLEASTRLDERMLHEGQVPTFHTALKAGKVKWKPEPPGLESFDHARKVLGRGWGDCDDLAPWRAASLRHTGEDPGAEAKVYKSGPSRWHAVVQRSDGTIEDPSEEAGMRKHKTSGGPPAVCGPMVRGMVVPQVSGDDGEPVFTTRPIIACRPLYAPRGSVHGYECSSGGQAILCGFEARADLPWTQSDYAISALHASPVASQALTGAILGAALLGETAGVVDEENLHKVLAVAGLLEGASPRELIRELGIEPVINAVNVLGVMGPSLVGFDLFKVIKDVAPFVSKAVSFIPGVGPVVSTAIDVATGLIPKSGGQPPTMKTPPVPSPAMQATFQRAAQNLGPPPRPAPARPTVVAPPAARPAPAAPPAVHVVPPMIRQMPKGTPFYMGIPGGPVVLRF